VIFPEVYVDFIKREVPWIEFFAGRKYTAMRRTKGLSSLLHACSCVTITSVKCTSLNQKSLCSSYSFRGIKECDVPTLTTLQPGCNIHECEYIPSFWSVDIINCEWLVPVSRFSCFTSRILQCFDNLWFLINCRKKCCYVAFFNSISFTRRERVLILSLK